MGRANEEVEVPKISPDGSLEGKVTLGKDYDFVFKVNLDCHYIACVELPTLNR